jgi:hypothetical protein
MEMLPQSVLKRLQKTLPEAESHPDPDLLTAFAEHSLLERERSRVVDHLAGCKDCRDILAIVAAAESSAQLETLPSIRHTPHSWLAWPALRWAALAAGVLIVASLGVLQYGRRQTTQVALNVSPNEAAVSSPSSSSAVVADKKNQQHDAPDARNSRIAEKAGPRRDSSPKPRVTAQNGSDLRATAHAFEIEEKHPVASVPPSEVPSPARNRLAANITGAETQLAQNQPTPPLPGQNDNLDVVKAKNPVSPQSGPAPTAPGATPQQTPLPESPGNFRWAINAGVLQRSDDGGRSWKNVNPGAGLAPEFLAIAVNGLGVWVGGSASSLYHSTDGGIHWARLTPSANGTSLAGNIVGIQFSDPLHGKITTSTSEIWTTSDGGQSWQKQQ